MSTATVKAKKITLRTADNHEFEVDEAIAMELGAIKTFFEDNPDASEEPMPLPNVTSKCLSTIIEYCKSHLAFRARGGSSSVEDEAKAYDEEFIKAQDNESLKEMILAANYLNIKDMLDMLNQAVADRIKNKSVEYVRKFFGIENDYTPEEEAAVRAQNEWAFQGVDPDHD
ncbi:SKP1-like protein 14 [Durio zibethinus]|uniref:SKP1-like protein n=1 Tax=Durio zibethinus TaxID=66656 RepID=A0A6P5Z9J6_DURZI|nr:SKP1-like protein 14 [Durio zibethinus]